MSRLARYLDENSNNRHKHKRFVFKENIKMEKFEFVHLELQYLLKGGNQICFSRSVSIALALYYSPLL